MATKNVVVVSGKNIPNPQHWVLPYRAEAKRRVMNCKGDKNETIY